MYDSQTSSQIAILRQRAIDKTLTLEELREAVKMLRAGRASATAAAKASGKSRATKAPVNVDDLFSELDKI